MHVFFLDVYKRQDKKSGKDKDKVKVMQVVTNMFSKMDSNDLGALKKYLDSGESKIHNYTKAIEYSYNVMPQLFRQDGDNVRQVNPDQSFSSLGLGASAGSNLSLIHILQEVSGVPMPQAIKDILDAKVLHDMECDADKMKDTVKGILGV